jgi:hypothetical protein
MIKICNPNLLKCYYGVEEKYIDVSRHIFNFINNNILKIKICNENMKCDPIPNKLKHLKVKYKENKYIINENDYLEIKLNFQNNIITINKIDEIKNELNSYDKATIFGKGPSFKIVKKKDKELRCAVNQAANLIENVDLICMNDHHNIFLINDNVYKNLKYLLLPQYLHIKHKYSVDGYFMNIYKYLCNKEFNGKIIVYNLKTSEFVTKYFIELNTALTSANNIFEYICKFTNIKDVNTYGIGINSKENYNKLFIGNGTYDYGRILLIRNNMENFSKKFNVILNIN